MGSRALVVLAATVSALSVSPQARAFILSCDIARVADPASVRRVKYEVDELRKSLDGEPAEISSGTIRSRKTFETGGVLITSISRTTGIITISSPQDATISSGTCQDEQTAAANPPPVASPPASVARPELPPAQAKPVSYVELEAAAYAEQSKKMRETMGNGTPEFNALFESYWQKRIENADRVDRGQLSPEAAAALNESYRKQALAAMQQQIQQTQNQIIQSLAQQQAQADAQRRQNAMDLIQQSIRLFTTRPAVTAPPPPQVCRWVGPNWVCN